MRVCVWQERSVSPYGDEVLSGNDGLMWRRSNRANQAIEPIEPIEPFEPFEPIEPIELIEIELIQPFGIEPAIRKGGAAYVKA